VQLQGTFSIKSLGACCRQLRPQNQPHLRNAWGVPTFIGEQVAVAASSIKAAAGNQLWSLAWIPSCQNGEQGESTNSRVHQSAAATHEAGRTELNLPILSLGKLECRFTFFSPSPQEINRPDVEPKTPGPPAIGCCRWPDEPAAASAAHSPASGAAAQRPPTARSDAAGVTSPRRLRLGAACSQDPHPSNPDEKKGSQTVNGDPGLARQFSLPALVT